MDRVDAHAETSDEIEGATATDTIEVTLAWGDATLSTLHVASGGTVSLGEDRGCDLLVPREVLGASRVVLVDADAGQVVVTPPAGATTTLDAVPCDAPRIELRGARVVTVRVGAFVVTLRIVRAAARIATPLSASLRGAGLHGVGFSTLLHGSILAVLAFFMPTLNASADEGISRDQLLLMQRLINASAEPERDTEQARDAADLAGAAESTPSGGGRANGASGALGKPDAHQNGRWSAAGDAPRSEVSLTRAEKLRLVQDFGILGLLQTAAMADPNAPSVPWGPAFRGSDRESHLGNLWAEDIGDAPGVGGLGPSGLEEGGGGSTTGIGMNDVGNLGRSLDLRLGSGDPAGFGCPAGARCTGRVNGEHHVTAGLRMPREIVTNGRLPSEVIQRIVRQNAGRFRVCYESALRTNPSLEGRVGVQFVIDRSGAVSVVQDSGSDMPDPAVRSCVVKSFYNLSFPAPDNGTVTVRYPLVFTPAS